MEYYDIYMKRLNRYGTTFQERLQGQREAEFENYLKKSVYRVEFEFDNQTQVGSLEKYQQDDTKTVQYLLTRTELVMPGGTVILVPDAFGADQAWMVWYLENIEASGYNRYIMLRMSHFLEWTVDGTKYSSWAYLYGKRSAVLRDAIQSSKSGSKAMIFFEDQNENFLVMPRNQYMKKDTYFVLGAEPFQEQFRVTGFDRQSTEGVQYVTLDPIYEFDTSTAPSQQQGDSDSDFFWLNGK